MPQMSPMPWILLFSLTIFCLLLTLSFIYFFFQKNMNKKFIQKINIYLMKW
uniref:ATP synthase F0 subunit 8 n=1 Tax=Egeirotrioza xingi TaxID=3132083 RepID=UPI0030FE6FDB